VGTGGRGPTIGAVADPVPHPSDGNERRVVILKSPRYGPAGGGPLPYRIDLLRHHRFEPVWTDRHLSGALARVARWGERYTVPWVQALLTRRDRRRAVATLAMFESEGHGLALWRRLTGRRRPPLVVVSCWLAELAHRHPGRRRLYRWLYRAVDTVVVFSANQRDTLVGRLGLAPDAVAVVRFGVDLEELAAVGTRDTGTVVAAGRDLGRDWATLVRAATGAGWRVELLTRPQQVAGLDLPAEVHLRGAVGRGEYLRVLSDAGVVVIPTEVREYPTGQTVLLEAMALGKACVVTDTPAMREYVTDGVDAVLVPPGDPVALRSAVDQLLADDGRRAALGAAARRTSRTSGGAAAMWEAVAEVLDGVAGGRRSGLGTGGSVPDPGNHPVA
jgi:glycosyltransferase involved in cell wall biosynthesis